MNRISMRPAQLSLLPAPEPHGTRAPATPSLDADTQRAFGSYFTPGFVAAALYERTFADLTAQDCVVDPTAGAGHLLSAVPRAVGALGVEIQPALAAAARRATGRPIVTGDIRTVDLERACGTLCDGRRPTAFYSNPPFRIDIIEVMLERAYQVLPNGGRVAAILPVHFFHLAGRTLDHGRRWGITCELLPRDIWPRISHSICWAVFERSGRRVLGGFALYDELAAARGLAPRFQALLRDSTDAPWRVVVLEALRELGGDAHLSDVYRVVASKRPSAGRFYREKVRQQLQRHAVRVGKGHYRLPAAAMDCAA